jgi:hypothetical protein
MTTATPTKSRRIKLRPRTKAVLTSFAMGFLVGVIVNDHAQTNAQLQPTTAAVVHKAYTTANSTPNDDVWDSRWDCRMIGNHICGPGNPEGYTPGLYSARNNGRLIITWQHLKEWRLI